MISIKDLQFFYKEKMILNINNLNLDTEKISILTGINGSGKSTLLRILAFLEGDFSRNITYFGKNRLSLEEKRRIYLLLPDPILLNRNVKDNFYFTLKTYGIKENWDESIQKALKLLDLDKNLLKKNTYELSSGQIRKISLAIALSIKARYYLLDEPSAFLDKNTLFLFKKALLEIQKERKNGFLIVSHDKNFLDDLAQTKFYLHDGKILEFENINIFDLDKNIIEFSNLLYFKTKAQKIAINPYKIKLGNHLEFHIKQAKIIALRIKKEFVFIRVTSGNKILEFALKNEDFQKLPLKLYQNIELSFDEEAIYFI